MRVLAFGTYDVTTHPRFGVLLEGLRDLGVDVTEVNLPLGLDTSARVAMLRQPWRLPLLALRLLARWARLAARGRRACRSHRPDAVLVGYLGHFDVLLARLLFPRAIVVLDHLIFAADTAVDRGESSSVKLRLLRALDHRALNAASLVVVDSDEHAAMVPPRLADRVVVVPVGAPSAWFRAGAREAAAREITGSADHVPAPSSRALRVVFFGLYTPLQGAPTIGAALGELAADRTIEFTMIGRGQDRAETEKLAAANPRVTWIDWVPSVDLPQVVAAHDVCLGILGAGPKAQRVVPNKVYQGAAAGCALVTSDTAPQRRILDDAALLIPPADASALVAALRMLADDPITLARLRCASRDRALRGFAPVAVAAPLHDRLLQRLSGPPLDTPTSISGDHL